ncbi:MAG: hypothetical protein KDE46_17930 [Caldilineaceae bacterium]|nr:hypothetical protein [Caldilineaceae bacterium]
MNILRWIARLGSLLSVAFVLLFLFGEGLVVNGVWPTAAEWVGLLFFPFGLAIGLLIGWRNELGGGLIAAGSIAAFYVWNFAVRGSLPAGPYFLVLALPALIYIGLAWRESAVAG